MSSFTHPHRMYLFDMKNGKKKLSYGTSASDAYEVLALRLSTEEMREILPETAQKIRQTEIHQYVALLG